MAEELVAQALSLAGALHQAGDVHKFDRGRDDLFRFDQCNELIQPGIRYGGHTDVGLDGRERIGRRNRAGLCRAR